MTTSSTTIRAAGGVVWRRREGSRRGVEVLLAHRPRYDDWTFPKGKADPGEPLPVTAVREVEEETGLRVRLGVRLPDVTYRVTAGSKVVSYWSARLLDDPGAFRPNREVDRILWARPRDAALLLNYGHDRTLLDHFRGLRDAETLATDTLVVLRHGKAVARDAWTGPDLARPLADLGAAQAAALVPVLSAYGVAAVRTSPAARCVATVEPFATAAHLDLETDDRLAEGTGEAAIRRAVSAATDDGRPLVLCSHRPTLPGIWSALGLPDTTLAPGQGVVVHARGGRPVATERIG